MNKIFVLRLSIIIFCFYISPSFSAVPLPTFNAIRNGNKVMDSTEFPFVVSIYKDNVINCTGSIIDKYWVLTAAHCVRTQFDPASNIPYALLAPETLSIGIGYHAPLKAYAEQLIQVKKVVVFNNVLDEGGNLEHDIALLELANATDIQPVTLPADNNFPTLKTSHLPATAVGYGMLSYYTEGSPIALDEYGRVVNTANGTIYMDGYLHDGNEVIQDDQTIEKSIAKEVMESEKSLNNLDDDTKHIYEDLMMKWYNPVTMLGTISPDGQVVDHGDSGGPLLLAVTQKDGSKQYVQIGVASRMLPLSTSYQKNYSIYANLTNREMLNFINNTMKNNP